MKKTIFIMLFLALGLQQALAQNFTYDGLNYTVTSPTTASVVNTRISGVITIPAQVTNNGTLLSVTSIGNYAFKDCSVLTSVTIPNSVTSIGQGAFDGCSGLTSVTIPNSVTSIGLYAFQFCSGLTSVTIPNSVTSIVQGVFQYCSGLTSVTIPNSVTSIGQNAFTYCSGLTSVTIPNSVTSIGEGTFAYCSGLTSVTIPNSVTSIGNYAFLECFKLTSVVCNITNPLSINFSVFQNVKKGACSLTVPAGSISAYKAANVWKDFAPITCATLSENTTTVTACPNYVWANNNQTYAASGTYTGTTTNCVTEKLVLTILSTATDQTNFSSGGLSYVVTSPTTVAVGINSGASGIINIPASVSNACFDYTVTSIGQDAFAHCSGLTSVTIPNSLTSIGLAAFYKCSSLTSVTIPNSVTSIGYRAFLSCTGLTSVTIGNSVTSIGIQAFFACTGLTSVTIPNSVTNIGADAFNNCTGLTAVTIPSSVTSIGNGVFRSCLGLTSVTIGNSVTSIGNYAFYLCSGLTSVTIPNSVTSIGIQAFYLCSGLTSVTIPNSVTSIGADAFAGCSGLTSVTIPNSVTSIGKGAFGSCSGLTSVTIPNSVTSIGQFAFSFCTALTTVTIPNSLTSIGNGVFTGCTGLTSVTIPNSVTSITYAAFQDCSGLTSVTIPNSVTSIGADAFYGCSGLTSVVCEIVTPLSINSDVFQGVNQGACSLTVPNASVAAYQAAAVWQDFAPITCATPTENITTVTACGSYVWANNNQTYTASGTYTGTTTNCVTEKLDVTILSTATDQTNFSSGGLNYVVTSATTVAVGSNSSASGIISIPASVSNACFDYTVTSIGDDAFERGGGLTSVTIPNSVTSIGDKAFQSCSGLTSVTIGNSVISIGNYAFHLCSGLTSVTIPNSVTSIGDYAFERDFGLSSVTIGNSVTSIGQGAFKNCSGLTSVTIPNSVTSIGNYAFDDCKSLTSVTIPNSVTSIGSYAFYACISLTSVTIPNSVTSISEGAFYGCSGLISVSIPNSVTSIGSYAIGRCSSLTSVTIPNSVTSIGEGAFMYCFGLTSVTIGKSVASIGESAFYYCSGLTSVVCEIETPLSINPNVFEKVNQGSCSLTVPNAAYTAALVWQDFAPITCATPTENTTTVTACPNYVWANNNQTYTESGTYTGTTTNCVTEKLVLTIISTATDQPNFSSGGLNYVVTSPTTVAVGDNSGASGIISIPASVSNACFDYMVTSIGNSAFSRCSGLTSVTIPNSVKTIDYQAFRGCSGLTSVTIPNSVTSIGELGFLYCSGLTSVSIPNSVTSIGLGAFNECTGLTSVTIPNSVTSISDHTFNGCSGLTSVSMPNSVTSIGNRAFLNCKSLTSVSIPNSVISIDYAAFAYCSGLTSVTIPNSVTTIGNQAFAYCSGLTSVSIPNSVTSIDYGAFAFCSGLISVSIPNSVTSIGEYTFYECSNLTSVVCEMATPLSINPNVFEGVNQGACSLTVTDVAAYAAALVWKDFAPITCATPTENVPVITTVGNVHEFCKGVSLILTSSEATGNSWSTGETTQSITVQTAGDYTVSANFSPLSAAFTVTERTLPTLSISGDPIMCTGGTTTLDAGAGYASYLWTPNNETTQNITVGTEADFSVTVTDNFGCTGTSNTIQTAFSTPVGLTNLGTSCLGAAQLALSGDVSTLSSVQWYNNGTPIGSPITIPLPTVVAGGNGPGNASNQFDQPIGITVDAAGNVYVADSQNHRIQKWTPGATEGITVAGGNGAGPAANQLNQPFGIAVDGLGNMFVADTFNNRIQVWLLNATEGITVAGGNGPGDAANQLINPFGVAFDAAYNLYVADTGNNRIQKLANDANGAITVAGGNGDGSDANQLYSPLGVAVDALGNIYVADVGNSRVQKWAPNATEGITVAGGNGYGSAANQLSSPVGLHVDASETVYIADLGSNHVMKWVKGATEGVVVAGGAQQAPGANPLEGPAGVFVTNTGVIYVSDSNGSVQKWQPYHQSFTPTTTGSYTAVVTNVHGCTTTTNAVVVNNSVAGTVSNDQLIFIGSKPANITLTGSEGAVQWQSSLNNSTFTDIVGATGTSLTSIQMGTLTTKRYYRAVVTSGSCASATSGVVTVTVVAPTKVQVSQCGKTLASIESTLLADVVSNANKYRFEISKDNAVVQELPGTISYIRLTSLTAGAQYGTTYSIRVKTSSDNGLTWSNYGTACSVTTPAAPLTKVKATQCGKTLASIESTLSADVIINANKYRFEISKDNSVVQELTSSKHYILLTNLTAGAQYGTTYSIRVKTSSDNGVTWSDYGTACMVTTPAAPLTKVKATQCGKTLASIESTLSADVIINANKYRFEISKDNAVVQELPGTISYIRLTSLTAGAQYGTTYSIRVKTSFDNGVTWSNYGAPCSVTTPAVPVTKVKATQCGTTLASITSTLSADVVLYANKYQFEISKDNSVVEELTSSKYYILLTNLTAGAQYGTTYSIRVKTSGDNGLTWSDYGTACPVTTPAAPLTKVKATQCGKTLASIDNTILADVVLYANKYRFEISKNDIVLQELTSSLVYMRLTSLTAGAQYGTTYSIRVKTSFDNGLTWSEYGSACSVTTPSAPLTRPVDSVTELATFKVTGYPNPYTETFKLDITTQSNASVTVMVYDMIGKLIEVRNSGVAELGTMEIGDRYATGIYNVIVTQGTETKTLRMIKK